MPNPAHTEHHHAMNEYKRNYKLLIEENSKITTYDITVLNDELAQL